MAKERIFNLPETKGKFEVVGKVFGTKKDGFLKSIKTKNNKQMSIVNFGVTYDDGCSIYENLQGMESDYVYFSKTTDGKTVVEKVKWVDRNTFNKEGFRLIGCNVGVTKKIDENGKSVNDKKILVDFDAANEIGKKLEDDKSVYTRGKIEFSSFKNDKGETIRKTALVPNQVSLCQDVDFKSEDFKPKNNFNQVIVFMGIDKEKINNKETGRAIVSAKIINYSTIEDVEFIITDSKLMNLFKKNLKPYTSIKVSGKIVATTQTESISEEDEWGEVDEMEKVSSPTKREFIITGATPSTIDKETYSQEKIEEALTAIAKANKAEEDFGTSESTTWGTNEEDDDVDW